VVNESSRIPPTGALEALVFDPESVPVRDAGTLLDPVFMGALHSEFEASLGAAEAEVALLQLGFLHGLRDALQAVADLFEAVGPHDFDTGLDGIQAATPGLALVFTSRVSSLQAGSIELSGHWPERSEAEARLCRNGPDERDSCMVSAGYTSGWLSGILEADLLALETTCSARGEARCEFVAREAEAWRRDGDPRAADLLAALPFDALRSLVGRGPTADASATPPPPRAEGPFDPEAAVVHIWGPVMVIPYAGPDEVLGAMELIGCDPSAREVSVIVIDLRGAIIDDAFGAAALERIVEMAERWDAETLLAGASPLSESVIQDLERPPLMTIKDINEAIALAFQIARSQRAVS
jgi:hypothetical protein